MNTKRHFHDKKTSAGWLRRLDWIASGFDAGQVPDASVLREVGLIVQVAGTNQAPGPS